MLRGVDPRSSARSPRGVSPQRKSRKSTPMRPWLRPCCSAQRSISMPSEWPAIFKAARASTALMSAPRGANSSRMRTLYRRPASSRPSSWTLCRSGGAAEAGRFMVFRFIVKDFIINLYRDSRQVILGPMFAALGDEAGFCEWVGRLGRQATLAAPTRRGGWSGAVLIYLRARLLLEPARQAEFRATAESARRQGALVALELGDADWIKARGPQAAFELAEIHPHVLFVHEATAAELGVPLEGIASVPVTRLAGGGCHVHGRRLAGHSAEQDT